MSDFLAQPNQPNDEEIRAAKRAIAYNEGWDIAEERAAALADNTDSILRALYRQAVAPEVTVYMVDGAEIDESGRNAYVLDFAWEVAAGTSLRAYLLEGGQLMLGGPINPGRKQRKLYFDAPPVAFDSYVELNDYPFNWRFTGRSGYTINNDGYFVGLEDSGLTFQTEAARVCANLDNIERGLRDFGQAHGLVLED